MKLITLFAWLLSTGSVWANDTITWPEEPSIQAKSWVLLDAKSGQILAQHNENIVLPPASMTKMMTLYLAFEALKNGTIDWDQRANVSEKAWKIGGSTMFLEPRMHPHIRELIRGIAIYSGNDAATAMAEHIAGSQAAFVQSMNKKAAVLGMSNTLFKNPTGFPAADHASTALDMAKLGASLMRDFPEYYKVFSEKNYTYDGRKQSNRNRLLWTLPEATGIKSGYTSAAGYCLTGAAEKGDMQLVSVVFGTASSAARQQESQKLLQYGLENFVTMRPEERDIRRKVSILEGDQHDLWLKPASPIWITIPKGSEMFLSFHLTFQSPLLAPIKKGAVLGNIEAVLRTPAQDISLQTTSMLSETSIARASWFNRKIEGFKRLFH
ncbi:MAG: D-alanyl-D-alanine carboxypeptidase family protein [Ghiorsea sp.]